MKLFAHIALLFICVCCPKSTFRAAYAAAVRSTIQTTDGGKKMVAINGKITPLFWSDDITQIADINDYAKAGFNTVVVRLFWSMSKDGSLVPRDLLPQRNFADAAAARGLYVIYALPPAPFDQTNQFTFSAANKAYFRMWENWTRSAMRSLKDTPNLIGWMLPNDPRSLPYTSDIDFRAWLRGHYSSVQILNKQWMTQFGSFDAVTLNGIDNIITQWRGVAPPQGSMSEQQFRDYVNQASAKRGGNPNWAFHPAELTLGIYRWDTFRALVAGWSNIVHQEDAAHLVFSGQLYDYAELLALPDSVDVSVPALWPGSAENDIATANPQGIDIARRAGRFCVMPSFATSMPQPFQPDLPTLRMKAWGDEALAHGASGLSLASWQDIKKSQNLRSVTNSTLQGLASKMQQPRWQQQPTATIAVLLTPLADGFTSISETKEPLPPLGTTLDKWQTPPEPKITRQARGLYGFCNSLVSGEPSDLVYALRWGTRFGNVDYLSPDDLGGSYSLQHGGVLKKYSSVLLPQAYWMTPDIVRELTQYTAAGGVIVADLGIGAAQTGGQVNALPPDLNSLLGVIPQRMQTVAFNLRAAPDSGIFPSWQALSATPNSVITAGDGPGGAAFAGPTVFTQLLPGTKQLGLGFQLPMPLGADPNSNRFLLQRAWLSGAPRGNGLAVYAPFQLWTHWRPGFRGFEAFHQDILGRGAAIDTILSSSLVPSISPLPGAEQMFPEMINYPGGIALINHTPSSAESTLAGTQMAALSTGSSGNFLWRGALCILGNTDDSRIFAPRPLPRGISSNDSDNNLNNDGNNSSMTQLFTWVKADQMQLIEQLPVSLQPTKGTSSAVAEVVDDDASKFRVTLWPGSTSVLPQNGQFNIPLQGGNVRLTINNASTPNEYHIAPNSKHHLILTDWSKTKSPDEAPHQVETSIEANADGQLIIEVSGRILQIQLTPKKDNE